MIIARYEQIAWQEVETLEETERNSGGFGSTGTE
jgi:dUTP pyrophosphatase